MIERSEIIRSAGSSIVSTPVAEHVGGDRCRSSTSGAAARNFSPRVARSCCLECALARGRPAGPSNRLHGRFDRGIGSRPLETSLDALIAQALCHDAEGGLL